MCGFKQKQHICPQSPKQRNKDQLEDIEGDGKRAGAIVGRISGFGKVGKLSPGWSSSPGWSDLLVVGKLISGWKG